MARTDDGEFELILGNRQLISVFLIVVILLGVFFAMGYIVGRNSAPLPPNTSSKTIVVGHGASKEGEQPPSQAKENPPAAENKAPANQPVKAESAKSEPPPPERTPEKKRDTMAEKRTEPQPENTAAPESGGDQPPPGVYWQVAAAPRKEADVVAGAIRNKGLQVVVAQAPNTNLFRVLVGPLTDASAAANARTELEAAGFKGFIRKKF